MYRILLLAFFSSLLLSCSDYQKLLNSTENEVDKYTAAESYYDNKGENPKVSACSIFLQIHIMKQKFFTLQLFNFQTL
jgi:hypothetical protein